MAALAPAIANLPRPSHSTPTRRVGAARAGKPMADEVLRLFVSSPGDVADERRRVAFVVERLNNAFKGRVGIEALLWEESFYSAHDTFQAQIPDTGAFDVVVAIFRARLGSRLPAAFPRKLATGEPYPSGAAYEVLSAIEARKTGKERPDIFVFRYPTPPSVTLDSAGKAEAEEQWERLKGFFDAWFHDQASGEFLAAFQSYTSTDDFALQVEACLRQWLAQRGFLAQGAVWDRMLRGSPFPGLFAFEADRETVFFGRELAAAQALDRLRRAGSAKDRLPFLLLIGASGAGKSSLLRAGLIPRLVAPGAVPEIDLWRMAIVTPGADPFASLAESLLDKTALGDELREGAFGEATLLARQLAGDPTLALAPIREALNKAAERRKEEAHFEAARPARLALAIDQAERLFVEAAPVAADFARLLEALVRGGLAYLIVALRSDAYARFQSFGPLVALREAGATFDLVPPGAAELHEIVTKPVAACAPPLAFEQIDRRSLADKLVADAAGGDALPLLQVTLSRLYVAEAARGDGFLRFADYRGMDAAVTETANAALDRLGADARGALPALVTGLVADVAADPLTGAPKPVIAALDRATFEAQDLSRKALVDAFVAARLLTAEGDGVAQRVRPAHEALLRIWPAATAIVAEATNLIRVRHTLEPIVREWEEAPRADKPGYLQISLPLLAGAQQLVARFGADVPELMRDFVAAVSAAAQAVADANRRVVLRTRIGLILALILAALAVWQWRTAQNETREAEAQRGAAEQAEQDAKTQRNRAEDETRKAETQRIAAEQAEKDAKMQRDRAEHSVAMATQTANGLVFDIAQKFRVVTGVPASMIKDILDRVGALQDQLLSAGESSPDLRRSQAAALEETSNTLLTLGETVGALAAAVKGQEIFQELLASAPDSADWREELSLSHDTIGDVQKAQGDLPAALTSYQAGLAIADRLAKSDPSTVGWQRDLSVSYNKIGDVQQAQGDLAAALTSHQADLAISERLAKSDSGNAEWQRDLSVSHEKIGEVQQAQGDLPAALISYQASKAIRDRLADSDPGNAGWQRDLSVSYNKIGEVRQAQGDLPAALTSYQASKAIRDHLVKSDPGNAEWQRDLSVSYAELADAYGKAKQPSKAREALVAGRAIIARLVEQFPAWAQWKQDLKWFDWQIAALKN